MKSKILLAAALTGAALTLTSARAQDKAASPDSTALAETPAINHVVYLSQLPAPADLMKAAAAQGSTITRMDQTSDRIVVVYQYSGGRTVTFAYTLLAAAGSAPAPAASQVPMPSSPAPVLAPAAPATTVVYASPAPVYYPTYIQAYDPWWDFFAPVAIGFGLGWGWHGGHGWYGGHGGWHGGGGWHH